MAEKRKADDSDYCPIEVVAKKPLTRYWGHGGHWEEGEVVWVMESAPDGTQREDACGRGKTHRIHCSRIERKVKQGDCGGQYLGNEGNDDIRWAVDARCSVGEACEEQESDSTT